LIGNEILLAKIAIYWRLLLVTRHDSPGFIAFVPNGATSGPITVSANGYQSNSTVSFTVINPVIQ
jgi:hypothetical protein